DRHRVADAEPQHARQVLRLVARQIDGLVARIERRREEPMHGGDYTSASPQSETAIRPAHTATRTARRRGKPWLRVLGTEGAAPGAAPDSALRRRFPD